MKKLLIVSFALILSACEPSKLTPLAKQDVIVAFGDSLTVGVGVDAENSYPSVLSELSGMTIISSGISGETTTEGLARLPSVIASHQPHLLLLLEGGNDILRNHNYGRIKQNLSDMIELALDSGSQVVLIGVPEKKLFSNSAPFYSELAEQYGLVYEPDVIGRLMRDASMKSDSIHFNEEGYAELAQSLYDLLSDNGAFH